jgi:hypothetical protein
MQPSISSNPPSSKKHHPTHLVRILSQQLDIRHSVQRHPCTEHFTVRKTGKSREPSSRTSSDGDLVPVDLAHLGQLPDGLDRVVNVNDTPIALGERYFC